MIKASPRTLFVSIVAFGFLLTLSAGSGWAQTPNQVRDPSNPVPEYVIRAAEKREEFQRSLPPKNPDGSGTSNPSFQEIRSRAGSSTVWPGERRPKSMSSKDRKRIAALLTPDPADVEKHRELLRQDNTGIFRLYPDFNCISKRTISMAGDCANQVLGGSTHSFRRGSPDLRYVNGKMVGSGFFSHEIMVDLGEMPIEQLTLHSPGIDFLHSFVPGNEFDSANRQFRDILSGINSGERLFSRSVEPRLDRTYAIRVIAFGNGDNIQKRTFRQRGKREPLLGSFQSLRSDKRVDVIVAFRVIQFGEDGNITVLWKQLSKKKSPVITFGDKETLKTFN